MKPTADEVLAWAREAGATRDHPVHLPNLWTIDTEGFQQLVTLAYAAGAAAMKERAAKECDGRTIITPEWQLDQHYNQAVKHCAAAIRALGDDE